MAKTYSELFKEVYEAPLKELFNEQPVIVHEKEFFHVEKGLIYRYIVRDKETGKFVPGAYEKHDAIDKCNSLNEEKLFDTQLKEIING